MCGNILFDGNSIVTPDICPGCRSKITYIKQPVCYRCGKQLEDDEQEYCHDCVVKQHNFKRGVAAFSYSQGMKKSMYAFKYNNRREYAKYYASVIAKEFKDVIFSWNCEVLVPVPLHRSKLIKRGYNQAEILAKRLSEQLLIPMDNKILIRTRNTAPLKELNEKERITNLKSAFQTDEIKLKYKRIILVDDIYTTGSTIDECAWTLLRNGAEEVYFITACVGRGF